VLDDHLSADIAEPLRAMLDFIARLAADPEAIGADDIAALRDAGLSDEAIEDAAVISAAFHMITRIADAFEFAIPAEGYGGAAKMLLARGYL
jgi:alkylhydroperoxidase family enzyme